MTRHDFDRGFLHFAAADVVYLFAWAAPYYFNNPHMRQPGWWCIWAGRASLEDRPSSLVTGGCWLMGRKWLGTFPVAIWPGALPGHTGRTPGIYCTGRPTALAARHSPYQALMRCVDWAHSRSLWPGALPGRTGPTPGIYASYVTGCTPSPTTLPPQAYATTCRTPKPGALPGLRWQRKCHPCQPHFANVYAISYSWSDPMASNLPLALIGAAKCAKAETGKD